MTQSLDRLDALLLSEATDGLNDAERKELETLLAEHAGVDRYAYERAASAFFLAVCGEPNEQMPQELMAKLTADAASALAND